MARLGSFCSQRRKGPAKRGSSTFPASINVSVGKVRESRSMCVVLVGIVSKNDAIFALIFVGGFVAISGTGNQTNLEFIGLLFLGGILFLLDIFHHNFLDGGSFLAVSFSLEGDEAVVLALQLSSFHCLVLPCWM